MSEKATCPSCQSYTSAVWRVMTGEDADDRCPYCGLSGAAMREVDTIRASRLNEAMAARLSDALMDADRQRQRADAAEAKLARLRMVLSENDERRPQP